MKETFDQSIEDVRSNACNMIDCVIDAGYKEGFNEGVQSAWKLLKWFTFSTTDKRLEAYGFHNIKELLSLDPRDALQRFKELDLDTSIIEISND